MIAIENDSMLSPLEKERRKRHCLYGLCKLYLRRDQGCFFDLFDWRISFTAQYEMDNSISAGISSSILHPPSAPVNIPSSPLANSLGKLKSFNFTIVFN